MSITCTGAPYKRRGKEVFSSLRYRDRYKKGKSVKRVIYGMALAAILSGMAIAQEVEEKGKVFVGFSNVSLDYGRDSVRGLNVGGQLKVTGSGPVKLEAAFDGQFLFSEGEVFQYYQAGPQVGVNLFNGKINPFVRALYGASIYEGRRSYAHSAGLGVDVSLGDRVFFRGTYDRQDINGIPPFYRTTVGLGARF